MDCLHRPETRFVLFFNLSIREVQFVCFFYYFLPRVIYAQEEKVVSLIIKMLQVATLLANPF